MWRKISRRRSYSYTEFGTNEKGVSVSATETLYGNEKVTEADPYRDAEWAEANKSERIGIEETDIPTIILAEASSAREGVKLLLDIYENYGCVAASGVFVCDKDEVWYVENCSGTQYVAIKLNNNMIFLEPNMAVIGRIDLDDENVIASKDLIAVAKKAGTFVGDEAKNIIDFRASYARISEKMDQRMIDGLNYLNAAYKYDSDALVADNTKFTISNLDASDKLVALYTNIKADRKLDKDDVFGYYKLSSIGKASNQEIEIFQLFKDRPVETATVGWVGVGNMSYNVFVPYYPMLIDSMYSGYQVSTASAKFTTEKPDTFCTYGTSWAQDAEGNWQRVSGFKAYPSNWKDFYYFTFEGLGGYIANADKITGKPLKAEAKACVADQLAALQQELYKDFVTTDQLAKADDARALATDPELEGQLLKKLSFDTWDDMFAAIGYGGLTAAKAVGRVIPELYGKMTGMSFRVPTADVSVVDLTAHLKVKTTYADICYAIRHASETYMKGIIGYTADQVVSSDLTGFPQTCIFDETAGIMLDNDFVKLIAWYDNEWGYSNMVVRLLEHMVAVDEGRVTPEKRVVPKDKPKEEPAAKEA